jgi:hypothetical protein
MGMTPETITLEYPHLTLAQVHAALAYYHANSDEIEADIAQEAQLSADWEGNWPATRSADEPIQAVSRRGRHAQFSRLQLAGQL